MSQTKLRVSPISRLFGGKLRSTLTTGSKQKSSITIQPFYSIQLDIQSPHIGSVEEALTASLAREDMDDVGSSRAVKHLCIEALPPILVLHVKRFVYDRKCGSFVKVCKHISFREHLTISKGSCRGAGEEGEEEGYGDTL